MSHIFFNACDWIGTLIRSHREFSAANAELRKKKFWVKLAQSSVEDEALSSIRNSRDCDARNLREPSSRDWNFRDGFRERKTLISQRERERERERGLWKKARAVNDGEWSEFGERELWDISFQIVIRFDRSLK